MNAGGKSGGNSFGSRVSQQGSSRKNLIDGNSGSSRNEERKGPTPLSSRLAEGSRSSKNSDNRKNLNVMNAFITLNKNKDALEKPDKFKMILKSRLKQKDKVG